MRTIMQFNGKPHPVMNCRHTASIHPPLPDKDAPDYRDKYQAWEKEPRLLIELEIVFPRYYWRAKYLQEGREPLWIVDSPATGRVVQLKDCTFENNVYLRLPNGDTIRGFPEKGMPADVIREHTAILEQEGLFARGGSDPEIKAAIAKLQERMNKDHGQHADALERVESTQAAMLPHVESVPKLVEDSKQTTRQAMADFYRVIYAPDMTPKQRAIADAMREGKNVVREAARILQKDKVWKNKGVSLATVCRELEKMDELFRKAGMPNPFEGRTKNNRARPVTETTYSVRRVDPDDPNSNVDYVPNRPEGYGAGETEDETP